MAGHSPIAVILPMKIYYDSKTAVYITNNLVFHENTKHIKVDCDYVIGNMVQEGIIFMVHVASHLKNKPQTFLLRYYRLELF